MTTIAPPAPRRLTTSVGAFLDRNDAALRFGASVLWAGMLVGGLVAGVGGRVAMRILTLTSQDWLRGLDTDDGAVIGQITLGGTISFGMFMGALGLAGAAIYLALRPGLPRSTPIAAATFGAVVGLAMGSSVIHPDGIDFTMLDPLVLAVVMFVAIPAMFGAGLVLVERHWNRPDGFFRRRRRRVAYLPYLSLLTPISAVLFGLPLAAGLVAADRLRGAPTWGPRVATAWTWLARAGLLVFAGFGAQALARDLLAIF